VDGNKRVQSKIKKSDVGSIKGYIFNQDHWKSMFFLPCDEYFIALTLELQLINNQLKENGTEQDVLKETQMYFTLKWQV
jgi:hypothetical protein